MPSDQCEAWHIQVHNCIEMFSQERWTLSPRGHGEGGVGEGVGNTDSVRLWHRKGSHSVTPHFSLNQATLCTAIKVRKYSQ